MASKKLVLGIIAAAAVGYYFYDKNKKESGSAPATPAKTPPERLNEAETRQYGINNPGVAEYFNNDWQKMADHWWGTGFYEGRSYLPGGKMFI